MALPGSFTDLDLPLGYAPFGIQVIGRQVFVTYAVQDAAKHDLIAGAGNGAVSIFDMDGHSAVAGGNDHDRIICVRHLDWRPSPLLVFLKASDTCPRDPVLGGFAAQARRKTC